MRSSNIYWKIVLVFILLTGAGAWWGWQAYPEWFEQGALVKEQDPQEITSGDDFDQDFELTRLANAERKAEMDRRYNEEVMKQYWPAFDAALDVGDLSEAALILALVRYLHPELPGLAQREQRLDEARLSLPRHGAR